MNQESTRVLHKTMERDDLLEADGRAFVQRLDRLARELETRRRDEGAIRERRDGQGPPT